MVYDIIAIPDILINRHTTKQDDRICFLAQTCFATFGKGVQLVSGVPLFHLTLLSHVLAT